LIYTEDDQQLRLDAAWHSTVRGRNRDWGMQLFEKASEYREIKSVLEIGCATGTVLKVAQERGLVARGFDTNPYAVEIAQRDGLLVENRM
tara:strand:+ start:297 stop:566 length:270 start_codon:yes stop_codon:yes gene_type:complete